MERKRRGKWDRYREKRRKNGREWDRNMGRNGEGCEWEKREVFV